MEFHIFDAAYVNRLTAGDSATESHFSAYFNRFLSLKLRARRIGQELAEDVRQETLFRVLKTLREGAGVKQPECFGAFVNAVCNNVTLELLKKQSHHPPLPENAPEPVDERVDLDAMLVSQQRKRVVARVLDALSAKDREILRLVYFQEVDRDEICERLGVNAGYLRVLLHRAKNRFEEEYNGI